MNRVFSSLTDLATTVGTLAAGHELSYDGSAWKAAPGSRVNVRAFGATGDGATDDAAAIASAITAAGIGGTVLFPQAASSYRVGTSLVPLDYQNWVGQGFHSATAGRPYLKATTGFTDAVIKHTGTLNGWGVSGIAIGGSGAVSGSRGIKLATANRARIENVWVEQCGDEGILIAGGVGLVLARSFTQNCVLVTAGRADYIGAVDVATTDSYVHHNEFTASSSSAGSGWIAAMVARGGNDLITNNIFEVSQAGFVTYTNVILETLIGNRADLNWGHGFIVAGTRGRYIGNWAYRNGRDADNTYDGFVVSKNQNTFVGNDVLNLAADANQMRHGFTDSSSSGVNAYTGNTAFSLRGNLYNFSGAGVKAADDGGRTITAVTGTYTALDSDGTVSGNATGGAFTVNLPTAAGRTRRKFMVRKTDASVNAVTVDPAGAETINGAATKALGSQYAALVVESDGTNWGIVSTFGTVT